MRLTDLRFLFFFISVLGEVVDTGGDGPVLAVLGDELPPFEALTNSSSRVGRIGAAAGLREGEGDSALGDWRSREGPVKGEYASDVKLLGWLPGRTRCTVAIDQGEEQGIRNDQGQRTLANCKSSQERKYLHSFKKN